MLSFFIFSAGGFPPLFVSGFLLCVPVFFRALFLFFRFFLVFFFRFLFFRGPVILFILAGFRSLFAVAPGRFRLCRSGLLPHGRACRGRILRARGLCISHFLSVPCPGLILTGRFLSGLVRCRQGLLLRLPVPGQDLEDPEHKDQKGKRGRRDKSDPPAVLIPAGPGALFIIIIIVHAPARGSLLPVFGRIGVEAPLAPAGPCRLHGGGRGSSHRFSAADAKTVILLQRSSAILTITHKDLPFSSRSSVPVPLPSRQACLPRAQGF
ncbi:MAG: hypothetical protein E7238_01560 [Sarcina sp.]|nr:hypothetical protein [Sarcina sp.]